MFSFLHNYFPQAVALSLGPLTVRWYGVLIVLGFLLGLFLVLRLARRYQLNPQVVYDMCFYGLVFGLIGDRLYYVIYAWELYKDTPWDIVKIWQGGLAIHGGILAGVVTLLVFAKKSKSREEWTRMNNIPSPQNEGRGSEINWLVYFFFLVDLAVIILIAGLAIGRWGNYFNQELFGTPTDLSWGIPISASYIPPEFLGFTHFHPTFLYESLADFVILAVLYQMHLRRLRHSSRGTSAVFLNQYGNIALVGLIFYSVVRFLNEFLRVDYSPYVFGLRWAQIMSIILIILCGGIYWWKQKYWNRLVH